MPNAEDTLTRCRLPRPGQPRAGRRVDIHCHCLPGLDDGPRTAQDALALCRALVNDGITCAIATPHQLGRYDGINRAAEVRQAVADLNEALAADGTPLEVLPGGDVRLDERIPALLTDDRILTLADQGRYLLLELPHETFIDPRLLVAALGSMGVVAILSHPERHAILAERPQVVWGWLEAGAAVQITAGSLLGDFGPVAENVAWQLLGSAAASLVATDAHHADLRPPRMSAAMDAIARRLGPATARRVCIDNPSLVLPDAAPSASSQPSADRRDA